MSPPFSLPCPARLAPVVLAGCYVRLEPLGRQHLHDLTAVALSDARIWSWWRTTVESAADVERLVEGALAQQASGLTLAFAVIEPRSGRAIGSTRYLDYVPVDRRIEIGSTWYDPRVWGSAVNPEAKLLLMRHAFAVLGCQRVQYQTDERNLRSRGAILRLGAKEEGVWRKHALVRGGIVRNSVFFSVVDDEWPVVEAGLLARLSAASAHVGEPSSSPMVRDVERR